VFHLEASKLKVGIRRSFSKRRTSEAMLERAGEPPADRECACSQVEAPTESSPAPHITFCPEDVRASEGRL
jgi:hypothetical protein